MNIGELLGAMVQSEMSASANDRMKNSLGGGVLDNLAGMLGGSTGQTGKGGIADMLAGALGGGSRSGSGAGIGDLLSGMLGGGKQGVGGVGGGIGDLLSSVLGEAGKAVGGNQNLAVGSLGALIGSLLGGGGKAMGGALGGGLMALLGALALNALKGSGRQQQVIPVGLLEPQTQEEQQRLDQNSELILRAMINAAKSDGQIEQREIDRLVGKFSEAGVDKEGRNYLMTHLRQPMETEELIAAARNEPELGAQMYAASLLAIEVDTQAEKQYLDRLATGLGLPRQVTARIEQMVGLQTV